MTQRRIAIVGAGLVGRTLALSLLYHHADCRIDFYDIADTLDSDNSCGRAAGGMVAPWSELVFNEPMLYHMGKESLRQWPALLSLLPANKPLFIRSGTLITAHPSDGSDLDFLAARIKQYTQCDHRIPHHRLTERFPMLQSSKFYSHALYFAKEAHISVEHFYQQSTLFFTQHPAIHYHRLTHDAFPDAKAYDHQFDTRGLGAKSALPDLHGVRGEALIVHAPDVNLPCCLRLIHPRHALYIIPRGEGHYYIGATTLQSEDDSPISVKSLLELTSALYFVDPGFAEARLVKTIAHCRPTLPNALPHVSHDGNLTRLNGFYRHGYLLAPAVCQQVVAKTFSTPLYSETPVSGEIIA